MTELLSFFSYGFVQRALLAGTILSVVTAILGVFVLLRRMSFFSDAIAHASLLGIAIGLIFAVQPIIGAIIGSILVGLLIAALSKKRTLPSDTIIGVVFSSSVALAIFIISILDSVSVDLTALLFGDILAVSQIDIWLAVIVFLLSMIFFKLYRKRMLLGVFSREIAKIEYKSIDRMDYIFLSLLALVIAVSLKILGVILVSALIIVPAASAQNISSNIRQMFIFAIIIGAISVVFGMFLSFIFDSPSGSTIVLVSSIFFVFSLFFRK